MPIAAGRHRTVSATCATITTDHTPPNAVAKIQHGNDIEALQDKLRQLSPHNDTQRGLQSQALQLSADIAETRSLLSEQVGQSSLPMVFLVILVFGFAFAWRKGYLAWR